MPLYGFDLELPANTAESSPVERDVTLTDGVLRQVKVLFPTGCAGLAHVQIRRFEHQLFPANSDGDLSGDGTLIEWEENEDLTDAPHTLRLTGWNIDDTYPHKISFWFNVQDAVDVARGQETIGFLARLQKLLGL